MHILPHVLAFTLIEMLIIGALTVVILVCLGIIIAALKGGGGGGANAAALQAQQAALHDLKAAVDATQQAGQVTEQDCQRMRELFERAASAGVNQLSLDAIKKQIDRLCPG